MEENNYTSSEEEREFVDKAIRLANEKYELIQDIKIVLVTMAIYSLILMLFRTPNMAKRVPEIIGAGLTLYIPIKAAFKLSERYGTGFGTGVILVILYAAFTNHVIQTIHNEWLPYMFLMVPLANIARRIILIIYLSKDE